jgi:hypothetical protein
MLEDLLPWLQKTRLESGDYVKSYVSLSRRLEPAPERFQGSVWTSETRGFFHSTAQVVREWVKACRFIGA